jgi:hypothetical protein
MDIHNHWSPQPDVPDDPWPCTIIPMVDLRMNAMKMIVLGLVVLPFGNILWDVPNVNKINAVPMMIHILVG